jgi:DNA-binding CsgD family transcriptional regulator
VERDMPQSPRLTGPPSGLVGRDEELRAVRAALEERGCVIAGPAGVGKTRLADDAVAGVDPGRTVIRVVATTSAATLPFGAVSHLLAEGSPPAIGDTIAALRDERLGPKPVVVVDDVQWLDDAAAALVLAIATTRVAPLLVTLRTNESAPSAIVALWKERHLDRVDLQPLSEGEVEQLVDGLLGAPSHAQAYEWIHHLAGGNPLYVTELVDDARRTGRLELSNGRWRLAEGEAPLERLQDLLGAHIVSVSDEARAGLELLALDAPLPLPLVEDLVPPSALEELERSRLAVVRDDPHQGALVDLAHPLYGELVRSALPRTAARRIRRDLADAVARHGTDSPAERLRVARLLLESGLVDEERFLDASSIALEHGAPDLARRLAEALPPSLSAALNVARGLAGVGHHAEVDDVLAPFEADASAAEIDVAVAYVETRVLCLLSGPGDQPERALDLIGRVERWHDVADWRALLATARCWVAVRNGAYRAAWGLIEGPLADPTVSAGRRRRLLLAYRLALTRLGRVDDHDAALLEVARLTEELGGSQLELTLHAVQLEAARLTAGRDLRGVRARVQDHLDRARQTGEPFEHLGLEYLLACVANYQGHHHEARVLLQRTLDHIADGDVHHLAPPALVLLAVSLAYLGEEQPARRAIEQALAEIAAKPGLFPQADFEVAHACAIAEMAAGRASVARDMLLELAASSGDDLFTESMSLHVALLLGADARSCAPRLEELAADAQDDGFHLRARHARALADRDPAGQLAAAEAFEEAGLDLAAAQAAALAAAAFGADGLRQEEARATIVATRCAERCPGVRVPALAVRLDAVDLTPREREIAALAARGQSNPAIAAALTLSVRTVETYVLRVYRKLGVNNRKDLAKALGVRPDPA